MLLLIIIALFLLSHPRFGGWWPFGGWWHRPPIGGLFGPGDMGGMPGGMHGPTMGGHMGGPGGMGSPSHR